MDHLTVARSLAEHLRDVVRPLVGRAESGAVTGTASSGDVTFRIDEVAEAAVAEFINQRRLNVAYYTEDVGLKVFGEPEMVLVVDPVDGSRGAKSGFECCVVSVAAAHYNKSPRMSDVQAACVCEIRNDRLFTAQRGRGSRIIDHGREMPPSRSNVDQLQYAAWTAEIAGRPAELVARTLAGAIDASSIRGGFFVFNSTAFSLTRLVNGQLSAVVDVGGRLLNAAPGARDLFANAAAGNVMGLFPYDIAAAVLIAQEAGCIVTDAHGRSLDEVKLLDNTEFNVQSLIAASNRELHDQFTKAVDEGFARLWT